MQREKNASAHEIQVFVRDLRQLFHSLDPSPFYDRDLDQDAGKFIEDSARELPRDARPRLTVHAQESPADMREAADIVSRAVKAHFTRSAERSRLELHELFRRGRVSLMIGLPILVSGIVLSQLLGSSLEPGAVGFVVREGLVIGGWVAMWRPMEIFLYDWWPIRAERQLFLRLAEMPVEVVAARR